LGTQKRGPGSKRERLKGQNHLADLTCRPGKEKMERKSWVRKRVTDTLLPPKTKKTPEQCATGQGKRERGRKFRHMLEKTTKRRPSCARH